MTKWYYIAGGAVVLIWLGTTSFAPLVVALLIGGLIYQVIHAVPNSTAIPAGVTNPVKG